MVVKPSDHTPVTTLELAKLLTEAGCPGRGVQRGHRRRTAAGRRWRVTPASTRSRSPARPRPGRGRRAAGDQHHLARVTLELGGKSAQVVFADADLERPPTGRLRRVRRDRPDVHGRLAVGRPPRMSRPADRAWSPRGRRRSCSATRGPSDRDGSARQRGRSTQKVPTFCTSRVSPGCHRGLLAAVAGAELGGYFVRPTRPDRRQPGLCAVAARRSSARSLAAMSFDEERRSSCQRHRYGLAGCGLDEGRPSRAPGRARAEGRHGMDQRLPAVGRRACRSAATGRAASAARTASTRSASTPRRSRSGSSLRGSAGIRSHSAERRAGPGWC